MDKEASVDNAAGEVSRNIGSRKKLRILRVISILDLIIRVVGVLGTLASALAMGTTSQTLPSVFNQFNIQLKANYSDLPVFTFFVVANAVACGYLFLSLPVSIYQVIRSNAKKSRTILIVFDTVMLALLTSGASAAAAIVYLAHKGNTSANWLAVCQQFNSFCDRITGSLVGSFVAVVALMIIIMSSSAALSRC